MQVKTTQKISRSAVATVLATSSVALGLPPQTNAAEPFKDVNHTHFFYDAVHELYEKKVINGYGDGTFRPNNNVTRGEAAKMLALSLNLDVENAHTSQFSDVKKGDLFYKYIAALANKGVINGYPDGTFRPNEIVQRGAMAKMVALGYEFTLAQNITHPFKDVQSTYIFNHHIQTLVNLNITKGTSLVTFEPAKAVSRGELATFISRANKANAGKPTYVVDNIVGNKIYINSVGYTIGGSVSGYIKEANKSALIGAHIEGVFSGNTLANVTKLTLNAQGTANTVYTLDGGNSTFNGTLVINGSYLRLKNWTLNGQTIVAETPRKSLAGYNRLSNITIASLTASGIIDFTKPTNPDDGNLNNGDGSGSLNGGGSSPNAPYNSKLSQISKHIDFTNVIVKNLFVEQNRSYIVAQKEIPQVTIRRDVEFAELNFNMRNLYIEGDESLTLYGNHDINTVFKNSYYSVFFNTNSEIGTLILDNSNGWIDLGDYVAIDKVIIPPNKTPNDIFDDYKNDNDKIGVIEDNKGGEVDRDPIENGIVPDVTKPIVYDLTVLPDSNQATVTLTVNETGQYHYLILPESTPAPTVREIVSTQSGLSGKGQISSSNMTPDGRFTTTFVVSGLESVMDYTIYVVHVDDAGNFSTRQDVDFATKDGTPPQFDGVGSTTKVSPLPGGRRIQFDFKASETGEYYYFVREAQNVDNTITVDDVIAGAQDSGKVTPQMVTNGHKIVIREDENGNRLKPLTRYIVYSVLVDDSGNKIIQANMFKSPVTTSVLDETPPYVTGENENKKQQLVPANTTLNQFYLYFSEKVDKELAEDVNNYLLTGTGIINVPGQAPITPSKVVYEESRNRVLITIPSLTGFVNGDTLRVTVLPAIKDLAENEFENINNMINITSPRNYAEYRHIDSEKPNLLNLKIVRNVENTMAEINFNATKAGTVYYMILPTGTNLEDMGIDSKDFIDEFNPNTATGKFNTSLGKLYLEGEGNLKPSITAELGQQKFDYNLTNLRPDIYTSYDLYIVLKDRSGNLSKIENASIIYDKVAPEIRGFEAKAARVNINQADNTGAQLQFISNEPGTVYYRIEKKYVVDTAKSTSTNKVYKLNPKVYNPDGSKINLNNTVIANKTTNADKEKAFSDYFNSSEKSQDIPMTAGLNPINITGLDPYQEYVAIIAVKDTPGNFTILDSDDNHLISEFYTDHVKPKVINNLAIQNLDGTFTITFSESIMRNYVSASSDSIDLTQVSSLASMPLSDIVTMTGEDVNNFEIVSYTVGNSIDAHSELVIRKKSGGSASSFEVTIKDNIVDQLINKGNQFDKTNNMHKGQFIKRQFTTEFVEILHEDPATRKTINAIFDFASTPEFDTTELVTYYYQVISGPLTGSIALPDIKEVINNATGVYVTNSLATGVRTDDVNKGRNKITLTHEVLFTTNDILMLVLEDKYGNRILMHEKIGYVYQSPTQITP